MIDTNINDHGNTLIEFLHESQMCILNGRGNPYLDGYTSISTKGTAVVDYIIVPIKDYCQFSEFKVETCLDIIKRLFIEHYVGDKCKPPDHSVLSCCFNVSQYDSIQGHETPEEEVKNEEQKIKKYKVQNIPGNFMNSEASALEIINIIEKIELSRETQENTNDIYNNICEMILTEMKENIEELKPSAHLKKRFRPRKPYWNNELNEKFRNVIEKEKRFIKCKFRDRKHELKREYKESRHTFDKLYRKTKREYNRAKMIEIDNSCLTNPNHFWEEIKKLGPKRKNNIIMETYDKDGQIVCDKESVLNIWKSSFESLFQNKDIDESLESKVRARILDDSIYLNQLRMVDPLYEEISNLNRNIELEEVKKAVDKSKRRKAVGIDMLPNEVIKNAKVTELLHKLFQYCMDSGLVPEQWTMAIIKPIPKSRENDPRIPLNYKGISLG